MRFGKSIMALVADRGFRRNLGTGKSLSFVRCHLWENKKTKRNQVL